MVLSIAQELYACFDTVSTKKFNIQGVDDCKKNNASILSVHRVLPRSVFQELQKIVLEIFHRKNVKMSFCKSQYLENS